MQIQIAELPELTRSRLLAAIKNPPHHTFLIYESKRLWAALGIVCALLSLAFIVAQADGYRWEPEDRTAYLLVFLASVIMLWICVTYIIKSFRCQFKAYVLINPFYFLRFRFDRLDAIPLRTTLNWDLKHLTDSKGNYRGTTFYFDSDTGQRQYLKVKTLGAANALTTALRDFPAYLASLFHRQDSSTLYDLDILYEWYKREEQFPRSPIGNPGGLRYIGQRLHPLVFPALIGAAAFFLVINPFNNHRDDEIRWQSAQQAGKATAYRLYLASRPDGSHVSQAHDAIAKLYEDAAANYRASSGLATSQGIEAVIRVLEYAKATGHYKIPVEFSAQNLIPPDIDERVRVATKVPKVIPVLPSFTSSMNQTREATILGRISDSFGKIIPGDVLQFVQGQASSQEVSFNVAYVIRTSGDLYYPVSQEHFAEAGRDWYTGISIAWQFYISVPGGESPFQFLLKSEPAQLVQVAFTRTSGESEFTPGEAYSAMADSAFDDFGSKLLTQLSVK